MVEGVHRMTWPIILTTSFLLNSRMKYSIIRVGIELVHISGRVSLCFLCHVPFSHTKGFCFIISNIRSTFTQKVDPLLLCEPPLRKVSFKIPLEDSSSILRVMSLTSLVIRIYGFLVMSRHTTLKTNISKSTSTLWLAMRPTSLLAIPTKQVNLM